MAGRNGCILRRLESRGGRKWPASPCLVSLTSRYDAAPCSSSWCSPRCFSRRPPRRRPTPSSRPRNPRSSTARICPVGRPTCPRRTRTRGARQLHRPRRHAREPGHAARASAHRRRCIATTGWRSSTGSRASPATAACWSMRRGRARSSKMFPQSIEVQMHHDDAGDFWCIEENIEVPDMEKRRPRKEGQKCGGSDGDARRILNLTDGSEKPLGEWNTMVDRGARPHREGVGQRRPRQRRLQQHRRPGQDRPPGRRRGGRVPPDRDRSAASASRRRAGDSTPAAAGTGWRAAVATPTASPLSLTPASTTSDQRSRGQREAVPRFAPSCCNSSRTAVSSWLSLPTRLSPIGRVTLTSTGAG